jgi:hypothetical protein
MSAAQNDNASGQAGEVGKTKSTLDIFSYPDPHSVKGRTLGALLRGENLTHFDCWRRFGSARLSHHIYMLRKDGWQIKMIEDDVKTSDADRTASIGIYWLSDQAINAAGENGRIYAAEAARIEIERRAA